MRNLAKFEIIGRIGKIDGSVANSDAVAKVGPLDW